MDVQDSTEEAGEGEGLGQEEEEGGREQEEEEWLLAPGCSWLQVG